MPIDGLEAQGWKRVPKTERTSDTPVEAGREYHVSGTVTFAGPWRPKRYPFDLSREQYRDFVETYNREMRWAMWRFGYHFPCYERRRAMHSAYRRRKR